MTEEWKWVKGYEGLYQISNLGRLKSFHRCADGKICSVKNKTGWYLTIGLSDKYGYKETMRIHVLVAKAFIGEIPKGYHVHHKDGNKQNNKVNNLEIIHPSQHAKETIKKNKNVLLGLNTYNKYVRPKTIQQYSLDGFLLAEYVNAEIASRMSGVCRRNILQVASKQPFNSKGSVRKQAGGYVWKYKDDSEVV